MAIDGKLEFVKMTNPWGSAEDDDEAKKLAAQKPDPDAAIQQLLGAVQRRQARDARHKKKPRTK